MQQLMLTKFPYLFLLFARSIALCIFSPLFLNRGISLSLRSLLSLLIVLILLPQLSQKTLPVADSFTLWLVILKELGVGYLIGTILSFLIEAAILAGNWGAAMMGFSATELLDPSKNSNQPLLSKFFILTSIAILLAFDMHHVFAYFLFDSFSLFPLDSSFFSSDSLLRLSQSASFIFTQAFSYLFLPLLVLMILLLFLAFLSKFNPELPIFWLGFPLQILIGISSLIMMLLVIAPLLQKGVMELLEHFQYLMQENINDSL